MNSISVIIIQRSSLQPINQLPRRWLVLGRPYEWVVSLHQIKGQILWPRFYVPCFARGHQLPTTSNKLLTLRWSSFRQLSRFLLSCLGLLASCPRRFQIIWVRVMVFNATFNNISTISCRNDIALKLLGQIYGD